MMDRLVQPFARSVKGSSCLRLPCLNVHFPRLSVIAVNVKLADKVKCFPLNEALLSLLCAQSYPEQPWDWQNKMEQVLAVPAKHFIILMDFRLILKFFQEHMSKSCIHTNTQNLDFKKKKKKTLNQQSLDMKNKEIKRRQSRHLTTHIPVFEGLSVERQAATLWLTGWAFWS